MNPPNSAWLPLPDGSACAAPADCPFPANDEVHVWRLNLAVEEEGDTPDCLSADELARAQRFRFAPDRDRFVTRRARLRHRLSQYLGCDPAEVQFTEGTFGKPACAAPAGAGALRFSYSHSHDLALLAVTQGREVGVDVERQRPLPDARLMAESCFAPAESTALASLADGAFLPAFFDCWTRKEAFVKALGLGLTFPLRAFVVSLGRPAELLELHGLPPAPGSWMLLELEADDGYAAALAVEGGPVRVRYCEPVAAPAAQRPWDPVSKPTFGELSRTVARPHSLATSRQ